MIIGAFGVLVSPSVLQETAQQQIFGELSAQGAVRWICGAENVLCPSSEKRAALRSYRPDFVQLLSKKNNTQLFIFSSSLQEIQGAPTASLNCTCCRGSDLLHVGLQHVRVPGAVRTELGVKTGADVLWRHMSPSRVAGCDFGVPVWHQDVVPMNVFAVHMWAAVPGVVKNMNIIKYGPLGAGDGHNSFGVAASRAGLTRGRGGVTGHGAPVHLTPDHR